MEPKETSSRLAGLSPAKRALLERRMRGEAQGPRAAGIGRREGTGPAPLSFSQQRLWFLDQLEPGSPTYNLRVLLRLSGPLHREALGRSFQEVARRHEVLRTAFQVADGVPVQAVLPWLELPLPWIDLTALPEGERQGESLRQAQALADRSFDLSRPPLVRLALFDAGAGVHHLLVVMHHIVSDGWSTGVLVREVGALYNAFVVDGPSPLPELPIQYGDFAVWQRGWLAGGDSGGVKEQHLGYWRERLAGAPAGLDLPTDRPRPAVQSFRGATHRFAVGAALTAALTALARREGMTPFMVLAAGLFSLLSRLSGEDDLCLGTPIANRNRPEVEGLIGFFVNTLVLRAGAASQKDVLALLHHVREVTLGAYAHQDLPFEELVAELHPDRDLSRTPLFQVALAYENAPPLGSALAGVELAPVELPVGSAKFDLAFILRGDGETLAGTLEYATDLYDGATAARLCDHWLRLLAAAVADPALEPAAIELLSPAERHQLLREWNDTRAATASGEALLHQPFEARVELHPDAEAVTWEGESLTYGQLEERANRLASLLQRLGAGPASPVAVWMERSLDMVTALLAASKAGATYLPIDAGWPADRAEAVLAGTGAAFVLTRRAHLPAVQELQWRLPRLADAVCLDVDTPAPPPEPLDAAAVRGLFDVVADRAGDWVDDWVTAAGFVSSYTGEAFAEADVLEYRDRVLALAEPWLAPDGSGAGGKRVLEIGAGSGLILWELAPRVGPGGQYVGVDPSPRTQERNRERAAREGQANVVFPTGFAHEIADLAETPAESFDLVILASTVQFFPGLSYLEHVLELALSRLAPGGALVVADVMDPRRREDFRRSLAAWAASHPGSAAASPSARAGDRTGEGRLYVDEDLFADLFGGAASVHHRETGFANELGFRYDVVIRKTDPADRDRRRKRVWTGWHVAAAPAARPLPGTSPADIAYVIHTSGSTGAPKGIVVQHRPAVELCRWINSTFGVGPGDRLLFITSPAFDLSVYDVFGVLAAGGVVHVASEAALRDPEELVRLLVEEPVTIWDSAPAALQQLAPLLPAGPESHEARLRLVLLSGDWIPVPLPDVVRAAFPGARVISLGGATEATVWSNWYPIGEVDPRWPSIPYGRPITNARYHVLDATLQPCAIGVPGDLYIGGDCLCVGYARLPAMTAERFIPDPFAGEPGARLYGTGDRARYGRDGNLEFLGRVDQQVKVRGYRIELEEIEAVLARHPGVRESAVVAREDIPGDKRLVGYFVPVNPAAAPASAELRASLQQVMPEYMVPWTFVALERMPITANGKLDRKALPAPQEAGEPGAGHVAPRTELERAVAGVWQEVLRLPRVGANDDFFELGGSSLLATQVISRLRQACGVELPLRALFEARTLAEMARRVESLQAGPTNPETAAPPLTPAPRTGPLPLSFAQQRLWFLDQLVPGSPLYNIPGALRLTGPLDAALLGRVLAEVARRHEVLRTTFRSEGGEPVQVIAAEPCALQSALPLVDLAGLPAGRRQEELARRTAAEARLPFDLAAGPLLRAALLRLGREEHVALITLHHIVADAWSMEVFAREIGALYGAWSLGLPSPLPELALQYADYAVWQRQWLTGEVLEAELEHWRRQLAGAPRVLELPADRPRPAVQSYRGSSRALLLPAGLGAALTARVQRRGSRGATLFMALLGAFATVLGRYAAREDVVVGSPVAGRDRPEIEGLIGFFVNTLVLRVDLSGDPGFGVLLDRVRAMALDAFAHQSLPFERLVDELAPVRDPSHSPLFQVAFAFQTAPREPLRLPGLTLEPLHDDSGTAKVDLLLSLTEAGGEVSGLWEYSTDLFDEVTIDRWSGHLASVLAAVAAVEDGAERPLSELPLLAPAERHQMLAEWNDTRDAVDGDATLDRLFIGTAGEWPDRVAVSFEGHSVTYRELAARAGRLARTLRAMGVEPEGLVGICAEEGIERVIGVVGTVLAGGAFLPLDPAHPQERLELMAEDARIRVLLTQEHLRPSLPAPSSSSASPAVVCLDDYVRHRQEPVPLGSLPGPWGPVPGNLSYVIYTSGSTGRPNGVQVCHRSAVHLLRLAARHTLADRYSRVLQLVSFSFDASVLETWLAFSTGGTLCVIGQETRLSGPALAEAIRREGITTMAVPPPILATIPPEGLPSLCTILVGGDRCSADLANRWVPPGASLRLLNCYGPTETTIYSGFQRCMGPYRRDPSIGRPIANLHMVVLDPRGRLAPVGVPGELCVGGAGTVRGYLHRPDLTAQRFVPDPFGTENGEPGGRLYRSGDLVRRLPNGEIEFLGRIDRQVKLRGLRIELGEIETLLAEHPAVRECAVVVREDAPGEKALAAYLVPRTAEAPPASDLRTFLAAKLPSYMVPTAFVTLEAFPLSPTGKIDHAALPAPSRERSGRDAVAARNQAEATLAGIWSQVLGVDKVGIHDNFFDLGGDSILCIQVVSRAQQEGLWLTARDLFRHQTVAELAALAATAGGTGAAPGAAAGEEAGEEAGAEVPLTPVQRLFFGLDLADPHHFNQAVLLALQQEADPGRLEQALGAVASLHSALRYRYLRDGEGRWHQVVTDAPTPLAVVDLAALPPARRRGALEEAAARLQPSLDLTRGPLLRAALFALGEEGQRLLLVLHHLIVDGVSWRILLGDLETAYRSLAAGRDPGLPPVATPFARWAARLAEHAGSVAAKEELPYWLAPARAAVLPLPADFPGTADDDTLGAAGSVIAELDPEATRALLQDVPKAYHTQINDVLLTALAEAFAGWTGRPHLLVDLEGHGREELIEGFDVSRTVGWFTSLFPVLLQLPGPDSAAAGPGERLKSVKEQLRAVPRGGIGYGLLRYSGDEETAARLRAMPPAEVVFNYLGQLDRGLAGSVLFAPAGESSGPALSPRQKRGHLLEINGGIVSSDAGSRLRLTWAYGVHRHHRATIQALADRFIASLRGLIEHCRAKESGDFTPSDFPEARFSQKDLDTLMARIGKRSPGAGARRTGPR